METKDLKNLRTSWKATRSISSLHRSEALDSFFFREKGGSPAFVFQKQKTFTVQSISVGSQAKSARLKSGFKLLPVRLAMLQLALSEILHPSGTSEKLAIAKLSNIVGIALVEAEG